MSKEREIDEAERAAEIMRAVEHIRARASPVRNNILFSYARTAHTSFEEVEALRLEGYSFITISQEFAVRGLLPQDADPYSFSRAFRREAAKRQRLYGSKDAKKETQSAGNDTRETVAKPAKNDSKPDVKQPQRQEKSNDFPASPATVKEKKSFRAGLQVNPDNTFVIRPIDPNDLPEI